VSYNYLSRTEDHLYGRMDDINSEVVTLRRGAGENAAVRASVAKLDTLELQAGVSITALSCFCFRMAPSAYAIDGVVLTPQEGDEFERASGAVYRVAQPPQEVSSNGMPYEFTTSSEARLKVWTQLAVRAA
jgi:hypothetical protein